MAAKVSKPISAKADRARFILGSPEKMFCFVVTEHGGSESIFRRPHVGDRSWLKELFPLSTAIEERLFLFLFFSQNPRRQDAQINALLTFGNVASVQQNTPGGSIQHRSVVTFRRNSRLADRPCKNRPSPLESSSFLAFARPIPAH